MDLLFPHHDRDRAEFKDSAIRIGFEEISVECTANVHVMQPHDRLSVLLMAWKKIGNYLTQNQYTPNVGTVVSWVGRYTLDLWFGRDWIACSPENKTSLIEHMMKVFPAAYITMHPYSWPYMFSIYRDPWTIEYLNVNFQQMNGPDPMTETLDTKDSEYIKQEGLSLIILRMINMFEFNMIKLVKHMCLRILLAWQDSNSPANSSMRATPNAPQYIDLVTHIYLIAICESSGPEDLHYVFESIQRSSHCDDTETGPLKRAAQIIAKGFQESKGCLMDFLNTFLLKVPECFLNSTLGHAVKKYVMCLTEYQLRKLHSLSSFKRALPYENVYERLVPMFIKQRESSSDELMRSTPALAEEIFSGVQNLRALKICYDVMKPLNRSEWYSTKNTVLLALIIEELNILEDYKYTDDQLVDEILEKEKELSTLYRDLARQLTKIPYLEQEAWLTTFSLHPCKEFMEAVIKCGSRNLRAIKKQAQKFKPIIVPETKQFKEEQNVLIQKSEQDNKQNITQTLSAHTFSGEAAEQPTTSAPLLASLLGATDEKPKPFATATETKDTKEKPKLQESKKKPKTAKKTDTAPAKGKKRGPRPKVGAVKKTANKKAKVSVKGKLANKPTVQKKDTIKPPVKKPPIDKLDAKDKDLAEVIYAAAAGAADNLSLQTADTIKYPAFALINSVTDTEDLINFTDYDSENSQYEELTRILSKLNFLNLDVNGLLSLIVLPRYKRLTWSICWKTLKKRCRELLTKEKKKKQLVQQYMADANSRLTYLDIDYDKYKDKPQIDYGTIENGYECFDTDSEDNTPVQPIVVETKRSKTKSKSLKRPRSTKRKGKSATARKSKPSQKLIKPTNRIYNVLVKIISHELLLPDTAPYKDSQSQLEATVLSKPIPLDEPVYLVPIFEEDSTGFKCTTKLMTSDEFSDVKAQQNSKQLENTDNNPTLCGSISEETLTSDSFQEHWKDFKTEKETVTVDRKASSSSNMQSFGSSFFAQPSCSSASSQQQTILTQPYVGNSMQQQNQQTAALHTIPIVGNLPKSKLASVHARTIEPSSIRGAQRSPLSSVQPCARPENAQTNALVTIIPYVRGISMSHQIQKTIQLSGTDPQYIVRFTLPISAIDTLNSFHKFSNNPEKLIIVHDDVETLLLDGTYDGSKILELAFYTNFEDQTNVKARITDMDELKYLLNQLLISQKKTTKVPSSTGQGQQSSVSSTIARHPTSASRVDKESLPSISAQKPVGLSTPHREISEQRTVTMQQILSSIIAQQPTIYNAPSTSQTQPNTTPLLDSSLQQLQAITLPEQGKPQPSINVSPQYPIDAKLPRCLTISPAEEPEDLTMPKPLPLDNKPLDLTSEKVSVKKDDKTRMQDLSNTQNLNSQTSEVAVDSCSSSTEAQSHSPEDADAEDMHTSSHTKDELDEMPSQVCPRAEDFSSSEIRHLKSSSNSTQEVETAVASSQKVASSDHVAAARKTPSKDKPATAESMEMASGDAQVMVFTPDHQPNKANSVSNLRMVDLKIPGLGTLRCDENQRAYIIEKILSTAEIHHLPLINYYKAQEENYPTSTTESEVNSDCFLKSSPKDALEVQSSGIASSSIENTDVQGTDSVKATSTTIESKLPETSKTLSPKILNVPDEKDKDSLNDPPLSLDSQSDEIILRDDDKVFNSNLLDPHLKTYRKHKTTNKTGDKAKITTTLEYKDIKMQDSDNNDISLPLISKKSHSPGTLFKEEPEMAANIATDLSSVDKTSTTELPLLVCPCTLSEDLESNPPLDESNELKKLDEPEVFKAITPEPASDEVSKPELELMPENLNSSQSLVDTAVKTQTKSSSAPEYDDILSDNEVDSDDELAALEDIRSQDKNDELYKIMSSVDEEEFFTDKWNVAWRSFLDYVSKITPKNSYLIKCVIPKMCERLSRDDTQNSSIFKCFVKHLVFHVLFLSARNRYIKRNIDKEEGDRKIATILMTTAKEKNLDELRKEIGEKLGPLMDISTVAPFKMMDKNDILVEKLLGGDVTVTVTGSITEQNSEYVIADDVLKRFGDCRRNAQSPTMYSPVLSINKLKSNDIQNGLGYDIQEYCRGFTTQKTDSAVARPCPASKRLLIRRTSNHLAQVTTPCHKMPDNDALQAQAPSALGFPKQQILDDLILAAEPCPASQCLLPEQVQEQPTLSDEPKQPQDYPPLDHVIRPCPASKPLLTKQTPKDPLPVAGPSPVSKRFLPKQAPADPLSIAGPSPVSRRSLSKETPTDPLSIAEPSTSKQSSDRLSPCPESKRLLPKKVPDQPSASKRIQTLAHPLPEKKPSSHINIRTHRGTPAQKHGQCSTRSSNRTKSLLQFTAKEEETALSEYLIESDENAESDYEPAPKLRRRLLKTSRLRAVSRLPNAYPVAKPTCKSQGGRKRYFAAKSTARKVSRQVSKNFNSDETEIKRHNCIDLEVRLYRLTVNEAMMCRKPRVIVTPYDIGPYLKKLPTKCSNKQDFLPDTTESDTESDSEPQKKDEFRNPPSGQQKSMPDIEMEADEDTSKNQSNNQQDSMPLLDDLDSGEQFQQESFTLLDRREFFPDLSDSESESQEQTKITQDSELEENSQEESSCIILESECDSGEAVDSESQLKTYNVSESDAGEEDSEMEKSSESEFERNCNSLPPEYFSSSRRHSEYSVHPLEIEARRKRCTSCPAQSENNENVLEIDESEERDSLQPSTGSSQVESIHSQVEENAIQLVDSDSVEIINQSEVEESSSETDTDDENGETAVIPNFPAFQSVYGDRDHLIDSLHSWRLPVQQEGAINMNNPSQINRPINEDRVMLNIIRDISRNDIVKMRQAASQALNVPPEHLIQMLPHMTHEQMRRILVNMSQDLMRSLVMEMSHENTRNLFHQICMEPQSETAHRRTMDIPEQSSHRIYTMREELWQRRVQHMPQEIAQSSHNISTMRQDLSQIHVQHMPQETAQRRTMDIAEDPYRQRTVDMSEDSSQRQMMDMPETFYSLPSSEQIRLFNEFIIRESSQGGIYNVPQVAQEAAHRRYIGMPQEVEEPYSIDQLRFFNVSILQELSERRMYRTPQEAQEAAQRRYIEMPEEPNASLRRWLSTQPVSELMRMLNEFILQELSIRGMFNVPPQEAAQTRNNDIPLTEKLRLFNEFLLQELSIPLQGAAQRPFPPPFHQHQLSHDIPMEHRENIYSYDRHCLNMQAVPPVPYQGILPNMDIQRPPRQCNMEQPARYSYPSDDQPSTSSRYRPYM